MTPDGQRVLASSDDGTVKVWDSTSKTELTTLQKKLYRVWAIAVTLEGQQALMASDDGTVKVWALPDGIERASLEGHTDRVNAVALTPDGRYAISASADTILKVWELTTRHNIATFYSDEVLQACAVAPDGITFVAAGISGRMHILQLEASR